MHILKNIVMSRSDQVLTGVTKQITIQLLQCKQFCLKWM